MKLEDTQAQARWDAGRARIIELQKRAGTYGKPLNAPVGMWKGGEHILVSKSAVPFRLSKGWELLE